jgi:ABC-type phosphate/phosphonate transport system ATPase subunit
METALRIHQLNKHFANGRHALRDINISVQRGEMVALIGASGSGKSTLLRHVAGLVAADGGSDSLIEIDGCCVQQRGCIHRDIRKVRAQVGFVFQQFNLVARLPVLVNVLVGSLHRTPVVAQLDARLHRRRARAGARCAGSRGHCRLPCAARLHAVGRPAAARRDRTHAGAGREGGAGR